MGQKRNTKMGCLSFVIHICCFQRHSNQPPLLKSMLVIHLKSLRLCPCTKHTLCTVYSVQSTHTVQPYLARAARAPCTQSTAVLSSPWSRAALPWVTRASPSPLRAGR